MNEYIPKKIIDNDEAGASSADDYIFLPTVSGNDSFTGYYTESKAETDYSGLLNHIDYLLSGIFFFIVFIWVEKKVAQIARRISKHD